MRLPFLMSDIAEKFYISETVDDIFFFLDVMEKIVSVFGIVRSAELDICVCLTFESIRHHHYRLIHMTSIDYT